ncbi:hypothetical protein ABZ912_60020 [Nonomuraea angiospora]|uniref:hypothetical protein n=1 Tax=Nonomuraea angiospora TaxID=46172 RepID=UPI0033F1F0F9
MKLKRYRMKVFAALAAAATIAIAGTGTASAASSTDDEVDASAILYWIFENKTTGECLATYKSGAIRSVGCYGAGDAAQWHWIKSSWNDDYRLLKNKWTGKCLIGTEPITSGNCEDWTSRHWRNIPWSDRYYLRNAEKNQFLRDNYFGANELDLADWSSDSNIVWSMNQAVVVTP